MKNDCLQFFYGEDIKQPRQHLKHCVCLYNSQLPHSSPNYLTPESYEKSLKENGNKVKSLYDFNIRASNVFSGICDQNGCSENEKQVLKEDPVIPVEQGYSLMGCPPAEPITISS